MKVSRLALSMAAAIAISGAAAARAGQHTIQFDDGGTSMSFVIGHFPPQRLEYRPATDFSLMWTENLESTTVGLHVHVGSRIKARVGEEPRLGVRVNSGPWHWLPLKEHCNDRNQWLEIDVPASEWRVGLNRVEAASNVENPANMSPDSLDILADANPPAVPRSFCTTNEGQSYMRLRDRNLGIRLTCKERPPETKPVAIDVSATEGLTLGEPLQCIVTACDAAGNRVSPGNIEWSARGATVDSWGLVAAVQLGNASVTARAGELSATVELSVAPVPAPGVEPPNSPLRLGSSIPKGHAGLSGKWGFRIDPDNCGEREKWQSLDASQWGEIIVPGCWQAQVTGTDYHGTGWYRREFTIPEQWQRRNVWIRFAAAATRATVWINGRLVGSHTGKWTPFEFPLDGRLRRGEPNVVVVRVEELPQHFSAGFFRELALQAGTDSHFGGLWQDVSLHATGDVQASDLCVLPHLEQSVAEVRLELRCRAQTAGRIVFTVSDSEGRETARHEEPCDLPTGHGAGWGEPVQVTTKIPLAGVKKWSPDSPHLYTCTAKVYSGSELSDVREVRFGMRSVERKGTQILLNGQPIFVRGMLHWGCYPRLFSIDPSEDTIRSEFRDLRASGFNLVKVCLAMFPPRFYEIADQTGMLVWQEYPTWLHLNFPKKGDNRLKLDFEREYAEWFRFDRSFPSVILRDLTCEAFDDSNWDLLRGIYDMGKQLTGNALICDNSSFFVHRITDWYDCHTYGEMDEFFPSMRHLVNRLHAQEEPKPFLAGEGFDSDTYGDSEAIRQHFAQAGVPWWLDNANFSTQLAFDAALRKRVSEDAPLKLVRAQNRHSIVQRKAYMEEFRRYPEIAGYSMTHIQDNTITRPGFYDDLGQPKWKPEEWKRFNADRVLLFATPRRSHCYRAGERIEAELLMSNFGPDLTSEPVHWRLAHGGETVASGTTAVSVRRGDIETVQRLALSLPPGCGAATPAACRLTAQLGTDGSTASNDWPIWVFPAPDAAKPVACAYSARGSVEFSREFAVPLAPVRPESGKWLLDKNIPADNADTTRGLVLVTDALDEHITSALHMGARVVLVTREGSSNAFPRTDAPFWREMALWIPEAHPAMGDFPHEGFVDLQFLDMTQRKPFALPEKQREGIVPLIWGTNARAAGRAVYDYVFEQRVGRGRLIACCLNLTGKDNIAGAHLLRCLASTQ